MKRSVTFSNSVDGSTLKKIKKLSSILKSDEIAKSVTEPSVRHNNADIVDSESESESEEEIITSLSENEEMLNDEDRELLKKYNNSAIAEQVVNGMQDARDEVASNLDFEDDEIPDFDQVEGLKEHFEELRLILRSYKRSKIFPKTVKVLPQVENWSYVLDEIDFPSWTPVAVTCLCNQFRAKGGEPAITFYRHYLLPYVKENIQKNKRLDDVLFQALKEALYRQIEFMKGILFPWCKEDIEGKEADVLSNVIRNATVKNNTGTAAMFFLSNEKYSRGRHSVLTSFIEKKYNIPVILITSIIDYFYKSTTEDFQQHFTERGQMPLSWFKSLNLFISLYYSNMNAEDLKKVSKICKIHKHDKVSPAIQGYLKMASKNNAMDIN